MTGKREVQHVGTELLCLPVLQQKSIGIVTHELQQSVKSKKRKQSNNASKKSSKAGLLSRGPRDHLKSILGPSLPKPGCVTTENVESTEVCKLAKERPVELLPDRVKVDKDVLYKLAVSHKEDYNKAKQQVPSKEDTNPAEFDEKFAVVADLDTRKRSIAPHAQRQDRKKFRNKMLDKYNDTCVVSGCKNVNLLDACHIRPYRGKQTNDNSNGLLMKKELHKMFDEGQLLLRVEKDNRIFVEIAPQMLDEYGKLHGREVTAIKDEYTIGILQTLYRRHQIQRGELDPLMEEEEEEEVEEEMSDYEMVVTEDENEYGYHEVEYDPEEEVWEEGSDFEVKTQPSGSEALRNEGSGNVASSFADGDGGLDPQVARVSDGRRATASAGGAEGSGGRSCASTVEVAPAGTGRAELDVLSTRVQARALGTTLTEAPNRQGRHQKGSRKKGRKMGHVASVSDGSRLVMNGLGATQSEVPPNPAVVDEGNGESIESEAEQISSLVQARRHAPVPSVPPQPLIPKTPAMVQQQSQPILRNLCGSGILPPSQALPHSNAPIGVARAGSMVGKSRNPRDEPHERFGQLFTRHGRARSASSCQKGVILRSLEYMRSNEVTTGKPREPLIPPQPQPPKRQPNFPGATHPPPASLIPDRTPQTTSSKPSQSQLLSSLLSAAAPGHSPGFQKTSASHSSMPASNGIYAPQVPASEPLQVVLSHGNDLFSQQQPTSGSMQILLTSDMGTFAPPPPTSGSLQLALPNCNGAFSSPPPTNGPLQQTLPHCNGAFSRPTPTSQPSQPVLPLCNSPFMPRPPLSVPQQPLQCTNLGYETQSNLCAGSQVIQTQDGSIVIMFPQPSMQSAQPQPVLQDEDVTYVFFA